MSFLSIGSDELKEDPNLNPFASLNNNLTDMEFTDKNQCNSTLRTRIGLIKNNINTLLR